MAKSEYLQRIAGTEVDVSTKDYRPLFFSRYYRYSGGFVMSMFASMASGPIQNEPA
jgi:hypothetical protein